MGLLLSLSSSFSIILPWNYLRLSLIARCINSVTSGDIYKMESWWHVAISLLVMCVPEHSTREFKVHASLQQKTDYLMPIFTDVDKQSLHCKVEKTEK